MTSRTSGILRLCFPSSRHTAVQYAHISKECHELGY